MSKAEKKLQNAIRKEFETPDISFDQWSEQKGVFSDAAPTVAQYELADNVSGKSVGNGRRKKILLICAPVLAVFVALVILLACLAPHSSEPIVYGDTDTEKIIIDMQEITDREDIYIFDSSSVIDRESVYKEVLKTDNTRVMLYGLVGNLLSVESDGFYVTYKICLYPHYEFFDRKMYSDLENETTIQNKTIKYGVNGFEQPVAYAQFSDGKYEYYIEATGYEGVTVVDENNFLNLLNHILV